MKTNVEKTARWLFAAVILAAAAGLFVAYRLDSAGYSTYLVRTHEAVSGLIPDAPVEFHGVEVGAVQRVDLVDPRLVAIRVKIRKDVLLTRGTLATVTTRGLAARGFTGYVYVALEDDGSDARPLPAPSDEPFPVIRSAPSRSVSLDTAISQVNENVQVLSDLLRSTLDAGTIASLRQSVEHLERVTRTLAANNDSLAAILANTERATGALDVRTIASLRQSVDNLQGVTATLASNNERLATIILNTERASSQLAPLLQSSHQAVEVMQGQLLPEALDALVNLERLSRSLSDTAARIDRDPSVLIRGRARPPPGPGEAP